MEVDLELSVGGSFRNLEKSKPKSSDELHSCSKAEEARAKRVIQALRRQEAKKKREEKKKGKRNGEGGGDARRLLESQRLQSRAKDRERRENCEANLKHHKSKINHWNSSIQTVMPIQCAYPPRLQYVPLAFPCLVPCWTPAAGIQPLKPLPRRHSCGFGSALSSSATMCQGGGNIDDIGSRSSHTETEKTKANCGDAEGQSEQSVVGSILSQSCTSSDSDDKVVSSTNKDGNGEVGKPGEALALVEQMPCVSTTGNGPNGKTITGFLYRYTKSEVSIMCVCHGNSFTPAEFVAHAGGIDVSHPLRHITVVPSAFP